MNEVLDSISFLRRLLHAVFTLSGLHPKSSDTEKRTHFDNLADVSMCQGQALQQMLSGLYGENRRNFVGQHFWAGGYFVSTIGRDAAAIKEYIRKQEEQDKRDDQLKLGL